MIPLLSILAAYLLGAIPFGLIIGLSRGVDVRTQGSKNIGATNVGRVVGSKWGKLTLALDIAKGLAPTLAYGWLVTPALPSAIDLLLWVAVGLAAVLGHLFPVYLGFRGGKGVATTIGMGLGVFPYYTVAMIVALLGYAAGRYGSGRVSVGSLALAGVFPIAVWVVMAQRGLTLVNGWPLLTIAVLLSVLIIVRHRDNIRRLLRGEEPAQQPSAANDG